MKPGRSLAKASPRRQNVLAQRQRSEAHGDSKIILLFESLQGSTPKKFGTLLLRQNFKQKLAQRDGLKAGRLRSFKAMEIVVNENFSE